MAFGNITRTLAIPRESTATYTFHRFPLCDAGPPSITISHAGDGTPSYSRATWHAANAQRSAFMSGASCARSVVVIGRSAAIARCIIAGVMRSVPTETLTRSLPAEGHGRDETADR